MQPLFDSTQSITPFQGVLWRRQRLLIESSERNTRLVFPAAPRRFSMICANGSLRTVSFDEEGKAESVLSQSFLGNAKSYAKHAQDRSPPRSPLRSHQL